MINKITKKAIVRINVIVSFSRLEITLKIKYPVEKRHTRKQISKFTCFSIPFDDSFSYVQGGVDEVIPLTFVFYLYSIHKVK